MWSICKAPLTWIVHAGGDEADIRLLNCNGDVRKILSVSNFEQLFVIA